MSFRAPKTFEAQAMLHLLEGVDIVAGDLIEVSPILDPSVMTAWIMEGSYRAPCPASSRIPLREVLDIVRSPPWKVRHARKRIQERALAFIRHTPRPALAASNS